MKVPVQVINAELAAAEGDKDSRTVPMVFYTGAEVLQFNWEKGLHKLTLSMEPGHCKLAKLNSGRAPFTLGHADSNDPAATMGVISNARIESGKAKADVRFSKREDVEPLYQDVLDGILCNVSVGTRLLKLKETTKDGEEMRSFLATSWEPFAVALVGIGADPGAHFAAVEVDSECEVELRATAQEGEETMTQAELEQAKQAAQAAERSRVLEINKIAGTGKLDATFAATHVEQGTSVEEFRRLAFDLMAARSEANPTREHAQITRDAVDTRRALMCAALLHRIDSKHYKSDDQNYFQYMTLLRMAEESLVRAGRPVRGLSRHEIAQLSMHNTADFPYVLENMARKQLMRAYEIAMPTYRTWAKASTSPDFKTMSRPRLSDMPVLLTVPEGAQITLGTLSESREQYALGTHGRGVSMTRQMIINDDLGAFNDIVMGFGLQAGRLENKTVYTVLKANANMSDGVALFHATHGNLGAGALGNTGLDAMFTAMGTQKGMDGVTILNLEPKFLIVPKAKQATAQATMTATGPNIKRDDQNWFAGRLEVVADGELDSSSTTVWYGASDPAIAPLVEYCHLEGAEGPQVLRKENEDAILGVQLYVYIDFAAKAVDFRSGYKSTGV